MKLTWLPCQPLAHSDGTVTLGGSPIESIRTLTIPDGYVAVGGDRTGVWVTRAKAEPIEPIIGTRAAGISLGLSHTSVGNRIKALPPELRPATLSGRLTVWWPTPLDLVEWWEATS